MSEPTHKQHLILEMIERDCGTLGGILKTGREDDIDSYWELVRRGYLHNLAVLVGDMDWEFRLTGQAIKYLLAFRPSPL